MAIESRTALRVSALSRHLVRLLLYSVLTAGLVLMLMPLIWMVSASFKANNQVFTIPVQWLPHPFHLETYSQAFEHLPLLRWFLNSTIVASSVTIANLVIASSAGYGFAKFDFPGKRIMFIFVLGTFMVPLQVTMVSLFIEIRQFHWINTYQGLIIPVMTDAFGVFLMRQFIMGIPNDYLEAARIDGANEFQVYWRIVFPMSSSALGALGILTFIGNWDEFLWPLIVVSQDNLRTIPLGLASLEGIYQTNYNEMMAVATLAMVPMALVFLLLKRRIMEGISISGLKM
jgi:multiple sugar transport system permease protein